MSRNYLLLDADTSRRMSHALWWRPKSSGYTVSIDLAGRYPEEEARQIETASRGSVVAIDESFAEPLAMRVVDMNKLRDAQQKQADKEHGDER